MGYVIAISGPVAVGKTAVLDAAAARFGAVRISTRQALLARRKGDNARDALQAAGEAEDKATDGAWVAEEVSRQLRDIPEESLVFVDAVRIPRQVEHLREALGRRFYHVHLTAPRGELEKRYLGRSREMREVETYEELLASRTEAEIERLADVADVVIDTDRMLPASVLARAVGALRLYPREPERLVDVIVGGQFGSEGKGNICAHLATDYDVLMRVGGPNAGHKVAHPKYTYVQLPSGTGSNPRARLIIGAGATISVSTLLREIREREITGERLSIDPQAVIIEDSDIELETQVLGSIASTKQGVGAATARKVINRGKELDYLGAKVRLAKDISDFETFRRDTKIELEKAYAAGQRIMLEGTQGTDLSLHHGEYPNVTSRETTASGCLADAGIGPLRVRRVVMVTRTYPIRVGGPSGNLPREISLDVVAERSGLSLNAITDTEKGSVSLRLRRIAEFDWEQVRRAAALNGATDIALTFADYISSLNEGARRYDRLTKETKDFIAAVESVANAPVSLIATDKRTVIDRRTWR